MAEGAKFSGIAACVFDAYGTLFDVHSAVGRYRADLGKKADMVSSVWRVKQLEYTWLRSLMKRHADFWQVTAEALDYALDSCEIRETALRDRLLEAYLHLDCYPEVPAVLEALKKRGLNRVILSNGAPPMLAAAVTSSGLESLIEQTLSVEAVGVFKPDPRVYQLAVDRLGLAPQQIAFLSSNSWDIAGAATFGLRAIWVNRFAQKPERLPDGPEAEIRTLDQLPGMVRGCDGG